MIVPTLCVGTPLRTLRVRLFGTQSVPGYIPTQSVGTIKPTDVVFLLGLLGNPHQLRIRVDVMPAALALVEQRPDEAQPHQQQ